MRAFFSRGTWLFFKFLTAIFPFHKGLGFFKSKKNYMVQRAIFNLLKFEQQGPQARTILAVKYGIKAEVQDLHNVKGVRHYKYY